MRKEDVLATILVSCIPLGIIGGLVSVWIDGELGSKIVKSSFIIGVPLLFLVAILEAEPEEEEDIETGEDGAE